MLFMSLVASEDYSFRVAYGKVTKSDFGQILMGDIQSHPNDLRVVSLDGGYLLEEGLFDLPIDLYVKAGVSKFDENGLQKDVYEGTLYLKAYYNIDFLDNRVRVGFGEGGSYTSDVLACEQMEATAKHDNNSKYLNYIDFSLDFDVGRLVGYQPLYNTSLGWVIKHRSGIFGLINNVHNGGSNYNAVYLETKF
jgi:outer membrane protein